MSNMMIGMVPVNGPLSSGDLFCEQHELMRCAHGQFGLGCTKMHRVRQSARARCWFDAQGRLCPRLQLCTLNHLDHVNVSQLPWVYTLVHKPEGWIEEGAGMGRGISWGFQHKQCSYCVLSSGDSRWDESGPLLWQRDGSSTYRPSRRSARSRGLATTPGVSRAGNRDGSTQTGWRTPQGHCRRARTISLPGIISSSFAAAAAPPDDGRRQREGRSSKEGVVEVEVRRGDVEGKVEEEEKELTSVIGRGERVILRNENYKDNGAGERVDPGVGGTAIPEQGAGIGGAGGVSGGGMNSSSPGGNSTEDREEDEVEAAEALSPSASAAPAGGPDVADEHGEAGEAAEDPPSSQSSDVFTAAADVNEPACDCASTLRAGGGLEAEGGSDGEVVSGHSLSRVSSSESSRDTDSSEEEGGEGILREGDGREQNQSMRGTWATGPPGDGKEGDGYQKVLAREVKRQLKRDK